MKAVYSVQARLGSTRLPGKVLYPLGDRRILELVVERGLESSEVDSTYITVGDRSENDAITKLCKRKNLDYQQGPEEDLVERHHQIAAVSECDILCRVTGDCPFVPPSEITRTIREHRHNEARYTTNHTEAMPVGTAVDVLDRDLLEELFKHGEQHPVRPLREHPGSWGVEFTDTERWTELSNAHTAVDTPQDYWQLVDAVDKVGTDPLEVTKWVYEQS